MKWPISSNPAARWSTDRPRQRWRAAWPLACLVALAWGCDDGGDGDDGADQGDAAAADVGPAGSCDAPAPAFECPGGALPFETETAAFEGADTAASLEGLAELKDQNLDALENPGAAVAIRGRAARGQGLRAQPIAGEWVSLWTWDQAGAWVSLGRTRTDDDGAYAFPISVELEAALHPTYAVVEGLQACALHLAALWPPGTQVVVTDIDETLTTADSELIRQISDPSHVPAQRPAADQLIQAWHAKGYGVVYLTARPHDFRQPTRVWLRDHGYPLGPLSTAESLVFGDTARTYKGDFLKRVVDELQWDVVAAYGNAGSDIGGYADAGIPKAITFIIGEEAGAEDTQAIAGEGYAEHIATYVDDVPEAQQPFGPTPYCSAR